MLKRLHTLLFFVLFVCRVLFGQIPSETYTNGESARDYRFDRLTLEDGLSQSIIFDIHQDKQGYMWFASEDGLNKYDGYTFRIYRNELGNLSSLSINSIQTIYEDSDGKLWIGTYSGLNVFDPDTEHVTRYLFDADDPTSLSDNTVNDIIQDPSGTIWIATDFGLNRFNQEHQCFTRYFFDVRQHPNPELSNNLNSLMIDNNTLWIGSNYGLFLFNMETGSFQDISVNNTDGQLPSNIIHSIIKSQDGSIWLGTHCGLSCVLSNPFGRFSVTTYKHDPKNTNSLSSNIVRSVFEDSFGSLWVGTMGGGLNLFDRRQNKFSAFTNDPLNPNSISYNEIMSLYEDRSGNLWIGTYGGCISKLNHHAKPFGLVQNEPANSNSLNDNIVWSFAQGRDGILWMGTHLGGLNRFDRQSGKWAAFHEMIYQDRTINLHSMHSLLIDSYDTFWVGCNAGLLVFDRDKKNFFPFQHPEFVREQRSYHVTELYEDAQRRLWIGFGSSGLGVYDRQNDSFKLYVHDENNENSLASNLVRSVYQDAEGLIWIGMNGGGLDRLDLNTNTFTHFQYDATDTTTIASNFIYSVTEDQSGQLWIATWGGGLDLYHRDTQKFEHHTMNDGLPDNSLYAVVPDDDGYLWLSSNTGLSRFDPKTRACWNFNTADGLQSNEFNSGSCFKSRTGELFFGGINGFNSFMPGDIIPNPSTPPVVITDFSIFSLSQNMSDHVDDRGRLNLDHDNYHISFEFAALEYTSPQKNCYAYKLDGFDKDWIYTNASKRYASYSTLQPGEYTFRVKASNNDGLWNETALAVPIIINPPFHKTWLFKAAVFILLAGCLVLIVKMRENRALEKKRLLESHLEEQTQAAEKLEKALQQVEKLKNRLEAENTYLQDEINIFNNFESIITVSPKMNKLLREVDQVAKTDTTVLILGESGTGKELVAREIHNAGNRRDRLLVKVNCAALPSNLIESELFGHERGSFTGAIKQKIGRFELADGGTIFLDEIGDLPLELQVKLLRVLQEGEFERIGSTNTIQVNTRVIAATNKDLRAAIKAGTFREDLYFRLNVFPVHLPPLRERLEDIPVLVNHFVSKYGSENGKSIMNIPKSVIESLQTYSWPGNIRELENIIERAMITSPKDRLVLNGWMPKSEDRHASKSFKTMLEAEKDHIINALKMTGWRVSGERGAAQLLGMNPKTLESKMRKLKINRPVKKSSTHVS